MDSTTSKLNRDDFCISAKSGFAFEDALEHLPDYFQPWHTLANQIVELIETKMVRSEVDKLDLLEHTKLSERRELFLAHLQLSWIVSGYVWQCGTDDLPKGYKNKQEANGHAPLRTSILRDVDCLIQPMHENLHTAILSGTVDYNRQVLPKSLAIPFHGVSKRLGIRPVVCHCSAIMSNWKAIDPERPLTAHNIRMLYTLPGGNDTDYFLRHTTAIEIAFTPAIQSIIDAVHAADTEDAENLSVHLNDVSKVLREMTSMLSDYHGNVSPETFYRILLPYFGGWGPDTAMPDGLIFEGVSEEPLYAPSFSAAQSCSIPLVDAALSVEHGEANRRLFVDKRQHMPPVFRDFIECVEKQSKIREYVLSSKDEDVRSAYHTCLQSLADFRSAHIQIVTKFVVMVGRNDPGVDKVLPYLKSSRDETLTNNTNMEKK